MRGQFILMWIVMVGVLLGGCYPEPTTLDLRFPTETHFLYGTEAQVSMFALEQGEINPCPALTRQIVEGIGNREPASEKVVHMCDLLNGGLSFDEVGLGNRAFVAVVTDDTNTILLHGCTIGATYVEAPQISMMLSQTDGFEDAIERMGNLSCASIEEKCQQGCGQ